MTRLVFLDMEMTGLVPETDRILEVAAAVVEATSQGLTDALIRLRDEAREQVETPCSFFGSGNPAEVPVAYSVIAQPAGVLENMNPWSTEHHTKGGLVDAARKYGWDRGDVEEQLLGWFGDCGFKPGEAVLAGNTIHFDRAFIRRWMPDLDAFLHYRLFDISTIRQFVLAQGPLVQKNIRNSVDEPCESGEDHLSLATSEEAKLLHAYAFAQKKQFGPDDD